MSLGEARLSEAECVQLGGVADRILLAAIEDVVSLHVFAGVLSLDSSMVFSAAISIYPLSDTSCFQCIHHSQKPLYFTTFNPKVLRYWEASPVHAVDNVIFNIKNPALRLQS